MGTVLNTLTIITDVDEHHEDAEAKSDDNHEGHVKQEEKTAEGDARKSPQKEGDEEDEEKEPIVRFESSRNSVTFELSSPTLPTSNTPIAVNSSTKNTPPAVHTLQELDAHIPERDFGMEMGPKLKLPSPTIRIDINEDDDYYDRLSDESDNEIRAAEHIQRRRSPRVLPISAMPLTHQCPINRAPTVTSTHRRIGKVLSVIESTSRAVVPRMKKYEADAQGFFQVLHFIYDMIGRGTLGGSPLRVLYVRAFMYTY